MDSSDRKRLDEIKVLEACTPQGARPWGASAEERILRVAQEHAYCLGFEGADCCTKCERVFENAAAWRAHILDVAVKEGG